METGKRVIIMQTVKGTVMIYGKDMRNFSPSLLGESVVSDVKGNHYLHLNGERYLPLAGTDIQTLLTLRLVQDS